VNWHVPIPLRSTHVTGKQRPRVGVWIKKDGFGTEKAHDRRLVLTQRVKVCITESACGMKPEGVTVDDEVDPLVTRLAGRSVVVVIKRIPVVANHPSAATSPESLGCTWWSLELFLQEDDDALFVITCASVGEGLSTSANSGITGAPAVVLSHTTGRLHHCQDACLDWFRQRRPCLDDGRQFGVKRATLGAECAGFCAALGRCTRISRGFVG
jgi:hypothetical protein